MLLNVENHRHPQSVSWYFDIFFFKNTSFSVTISNQTLFNINRLCCLLKSGQSIKNLFFKCHTFLFHMDPCWQRYRLNILFRLLKRDGIGRRGISRKSYVEKGNQKKFRKLKTTVHRQLYHIISKLYSSKTVHKRWTVDNFPVNTYCIF